MAGSTDKTEISIRFGCGFIFGLFCGGATLIIGLVSQDRIAVAVVIVVAVACGLAAARYGDAFWTRLSGWNWWWI